MNKSVVLITGASTDVGSAAAVASAKKNARVVAAGRREGITKSAALEILKSGTRVNGVASGPTDIAQGSRLFRPIPDQRSIHIKWKEEVQWPT
jgi:NAD(P)-dependent dehydrogenase (short-subunit alcohol dehydrogenase family)